MAVLTAWDNFYVIVGSSAGALTGLTFIAVTLVAGRPQRGTSWGIGAFTTPTVVHFSVVLFISALLSAPWSTLTPAAYVLGVCGVAGIASGVVVVRRFRRQGTYQPVVRIGCGSRFLHLSSIRRSLSQRSCCLAIPSRQCSLWPPSWPRCCSSAFAMHGTS